MTANLPPHAASPVARYPAFPTDSEAGEPSATAGSPLGQPPQSWLAQLRTHYPTASLVSELLQIHEATFVVRSQVQVEGVTLVTAMAAAAQIELAEDMAQWRVMALLGIEPLAKPSQGLASDDASSSLNSRTAAVLPTAIAGKGVSLPATSADSELAEMAAASLPATWETSTKVVTTEFTPPSVRPELAPMMAADRDQELLLSPKVQSTLVIPAPFDRSIEPTTTPTAALLDFSASPDPIDLSDAIAQIGTEIERIGWNKKQGSAHLQKTYQKRTRAELTEEELLEFLSYLKSLPSKEQVGLSPVPF